VLTACSVNLLLFETGVKAGMHAPREAHRG
jgi:hypothetical protein